MFDWLSSVHTVTPSFVRLGIAHHVITVDIVSSITFVVSEWMSDERGARGFEYPPAHHLLRRLYRNFDCAKIAFSAIKNVNY